MRENGQEGEAAESGAQDKGNLLALQSRAAVAHLAQDNRNKGQQHACHAYLPNCCHAVIRSKGGVSLAKGVLGTHHWAGPASGRGRRSRKTAAVPFD